MTASSEYQFVGRCIARSLCGQPAKNGLAWRVEGAAKDKVRVHLEWQPLDQSSLLMYMLPIHMVLHGYIPEAIRGSNSPKSEVV